MRSIRDVVPVICAAALVACADATGPVGWSPSASATPLPGLEEFLPGVPVLDPFVESLDGEGVVAWARGGGHYFFGDEADPPVEEARRTFAFTAKIQSDGSTQGQFQINNRAEGQFKEHGYVTCLVVEGNHARVGGIVTHTDGPIPPPYARLWRVIDNGEGSNALLPDMVTPALFPTPPLSDQACKTHTLPEDPLLQPVEDGNIQVSGAAAPSDPT